MTVQKADDHLHVIQPLNNYNRKGKKNEYEETDVNQ